MRDVIYMAALRGERLWRIPTNADNNGKAADGSDKILRVSIS